MSVARAKGYKLPQQSGSIALMYVGLDSVRWTVMGSARTRTLGHFTISHWNVAFSPCANVVIFEIDRSVQNREMRLTTVRSTIAFLYT